MSKEVIAVDVDEVLFPFAEEFIRSHNPKHGTRLELEHFTSYDFDGPLGLSVRETIERVFDFIDETEHMCIIPIQDAKESVSKLSERFELVVVTARDPRFERVTKEWLEEHFPGCFNGIEMVGYAPIMEKPVTKAEVCAKIGAIALVDDSLPHLKQIAEHGLRGVLFGNYPWNQVDYLPAGVVRKDNWPRVLEYFISS